MWGGSNSHRPACVCAPVFEFIRKKLFILNLSLCNPISIGLFLITMIIKFKQE